MVYVYTYMEEIEVWGDQKQPQRDKYLYKRLLSILIVSRK